VRRSFLCSHDTVLEIGPGKGIITEILLQTCQKVLAVELDRELYSSLIQRFKHERSRFQIVNQDILKYKLPKTPYKVFANIPFSIEGKIIRKLLNAENPPNDCYLVMRKDLAERLSGRKKEGQFSIFYKPWFDFEIFHQFQKTDYEPMAKMDTVLLRFSKKKVPILLQQDKKNFIKIVGQGFGGGKRLEYNLRAFLSNKEYRTLSKQYEFSYRSKPSDLNLSQWKGIFDFLKKQKRV
jgi:23S rRNA (adenine-N6)-dimethyltransferase